MALWDEALARLVEGEFAAAHATLDELERRGEDSYLIAIYRGNVLDLEDQDEEARRHYLAALDLEPTGVLALTDLGDLCRKRGAPPDLRQAIEYYRKALAILNLPACDYNPEMELAQAYVGLVSALDDSKQGQSARRVAKEAAKRCPGVGFFDIYTD